MNNFDNTLLRVLNADEKLNDSTLYSARPYWSSKINKKGISNFRGYDSGLGTSYCDNIIVNLWNEELSKIH